jgi:hypothetical protein
VGSISRIFEGLPFADMLPDHCNTYGSRGLIVPGKLFVVYLEKGGGVSVLRADTPQAYHVVDPRTGETVASGNLGQPPGPWRVEIEYGEPRVVIFAADADG